MATRSIHLKIDAQTKAIVHQAFGTAPPARTLIVTTHGGLCSRLKILLSGITLAAYTERTFAMLWPLNTECGAAFQELFQNPYHVVVPTQPALATSTSFQTPAQLGENPLAIVQSQREHILLHDTNWLLHAHSKQMRTDGVSLWGALLTGLTPIAAIADQIAEFRTAHFRPTMIGVHLRRGDFLRDMPQFGRNAGYAQLAVDHFLDKASTAGILLCSDDGAPHPATAEPTPSEGVLAQFRQRYGDRVTPVTPRSLDRRKAEAVQDALMELWMLRSIGYFVGTLGSTFSRMAMFGRPIPSVLCVGPTPDEERTGRVIQKTGLGWFVQLAARLHFGYDLPLPLAWQWMFRLRTRPVNFLQRFRKRI